MEALTASQPPTGAEDQPADHSSAWHEQKKLDAAWWSSLAAPRPWNIAPGYTLEMRRCSCGSDLSIEVEDDGAEVAA